MRHSFNQKRFWKIVGVVVIIEAMALGIAKQWRNIFPSAEVSELYARYAEIEGINASFVKDFKINDTLSVDVTLLETTTDSAWEILCDAFSLSSPPQEVFDLLGEDHFEEWLAPKKDYSLNMDSVLINTDLVSISWGKRVLCVFTISEPGQLTAIHRYQMKENLNNKSNNVIHHD